MKSLIKKSDVIISLELSKKEAFWLKELVQNPTNDLDEPEENAEMRKVFFEALPTFAELID